ncbi:synaptotagmin-like protein 4 [Oscarella lobularis]|uniref:synaptotagmin-like protein 4 n=1 Tax=Oscarella lobularis TaxID=121494 RepID=UPI003313BCD0
MGESLNSGYVFEPSLQDITTRTFRLRYSTAGDCYYRQWNDDVCPQVASMQRLEAGLVASESIEWNMADGKAFINLAATESGFVSWKIDLVGTGLVFDSVALRAVNDEQYGGQVIYQLVGDKEKASLPGLLGGKEVVSTEELAGSKTLTFTIFLNGKSEKCRIFPSPSADLVYCPFDIKATLKTPRRAHDSPYVGDLLIGIKFVGESEHRELSSRRRSIDVGIKRGALRVLVVGGSNLTSVNMLSEKSDPYVKCYLLPDASKSTKCKTSVKRKELNPSWNEELLFDGISYTDLKNGALEIWVMDWNIAMKNRPIGACRLSLGRANAPAGENGEGRQRASIFPWMDSSQSEAAQWREALERQGEWIYCWHALRDNMTPGHG